MENAWKTSSLSLTQCRAKPEIPKLLILGLESSLTYFSSVCFLRCLIQWPVWNESSAEVALGPTGRSK